jgi:hypothetical protein
MGLTVVRRPPTALEKPVHRELTRGATPPAQHSNRALQKPKESRASHQSPYPKTSFPAPVSRTITGRYFLPSREHALDHFSPGSAARKGNLQRAVRRARQVARLLLEALTWSLHWEASAVEASPASNAESTVTARAVSCSRSASSRLTPRRLTGTTLTPAGARIFGSSSLKGSEEQQECQKKHSPSLSRHEGSRYFPGCGR